MKRDTGDFEAEKRLRARRRTKLVPSGGTGEKALAAVTGWLADEDPFFKSIDSVVAARAKHSPRVDRRRRNGRPARPSKDKG